MVVFSEVPPSPVPVISKVVDVRPIPTFPEITPVNLLKLNQEGGAGLMKNSVIPDTLAGGMMISSSKSRLKVFPENPTVGFGIKRMVERAIPPVPVPLIWKLPAVRLV